MILESLTKKTYYTNQYGRTRLSRIGGGVCGMGVTGESVVTFDPHPGGDAP